MNALSNLRRSQNDHERHEETSIARALRDQYPAEFPTWGAAIAAATAIIKSRRT